MTGEQPLYERDPEAWQALLAEGNATQPRKRVGADALIRDSQGRILLVNPTYKPGWDLPGGMSEANEPPAETVRREIREELGIDLQLGPLLCVDWVAPHSPWDDSLMFIFDGGVLTEQEVNGVRLDDGELAAVEFCTLAQAAGRLRPHLWSRLAVAINALETNCCCYLQDGRE